MNEDDRYEAAMKLGLFDHYEDIKREARNAIWMIQEKGLTSISVFGARRSDLTKIGSFEQLTLDYLNMMIEIASYEQSKL